MKQCFCDCCGKQCHEQELATEPVGKYEVDLCNKCYAHYKHTRNDAINKANEEFLKSMKHQPLSFKYNCE